MTQGENVGGGWKLSLSAFGLDGIVCSLASSSPSSSSSSHFFLSKQAATTHTHTMRARTLVAQLAGNQREEHLYKHT